MVAINIDSKVLIREFHHWLENNDRYGSAAVKNLKDWLTRVDLQSINSMKSTLKQYRQDHADQSYNSIVYSLKVFNGFLMHVYPEHVLSSFINILEYVKGIDDTPSTYPLSDREVRILLENSRGLIHHAYWLALNTGLKKSELINLNVQDVDIENNAIHVRKRSNQYSVLNERIVFVTDTKPLEIWRLKRKYTQVKGDQWLFDNKKKRPKLVFTEFNNRIFKQFEFKVNFQRARTTYAYALFNHIDKINLKTIQDQLGLRSLEILESTYGFLSAEMKGPIDTHIRKLTSYYESRSTGAPSDSSMELESNQLIDNEGVIN